MPTMQRAERRLAAARLPHEPEHLALRDRQVDAVDGTKHIGCGCDASCEHRRAHREVHVRGRRPRAAAQPSAITACSRAEATAASGWMQAVARPPEARRGKSPATQSGWTNGQRGWKRQPAAGCTRSGGAPGIGCEHLAAFSKSGTEREQPARVRMVRLAEHRRHEPGLHHLARVHHGNASAGLRDHAPGRA